VRKKAVYYKVTWVGPYWRIVECVSLGIITVQHGHKIRTAPGWYGGTLTADGVIDKRRIEDARKYPTHEAWFRSREAARAEIRDQIKWIRELEKDFRRIP
jgi:hypothetical protein